MRLNEVDEIDLARRVAQIMGNGSAAASAVARYDALVAAGHRTRMLRTKSYWLVEEPRVMGDVALSSGSAFKREDRDAPPE